MATRVTARQGHVIEGHCHCGNIRFALETKLKTADLPVRACQCTFCRSHGARLTSDPAGRITFTVLDDAALSRYRFGRRIADYLVCKNCGFYAGAIMPFSGNLYGIVNVNAVGARDLDWMNAVPVKYDGEGDAERIERRRKRWSPAIFAAPARRKT
jgi:hypothetical protein